MPRLITAEVLCYRLRGPSRTTVRRHYLKWRADNGLPKRCDNDGCVFYDQPLIWNEKPFEPVVDHENGNSDDNRPKNLRLLCPNCDSQLATRGGGNKGRIERSEGGFAVIGRDGTRGYYLPIEPIKVALLREIVEPATEADIPRGDDQ